MGTIMLLAILAAGSLTGSDMLECRDRPDSTLNGDEAIRVMSYNIRFDNPEDGINAWPNRSASVAHLIRSVYDPDLIGMQEALHHQIDELDERLSAYSWVGVGRTDGNLGGEFSPIFYKRDKFELLQTNTFWLSETPEIPGSKSWDAAITRIVSWAKFRDKESEKEFYLFNTHFDHIGVESRKESARLILYAMGDIAGNAPVVLTGDLNVTEESEVYDLFQSEDRIYDARYISESVHSGPTASFNNWRELTEPGSRIDYIFVSDGTRVLCHRLADDRYEDRFPSDHLPVISDVVLMND
jgi:endonuclease/exonuclease/phosphatase family metal-dependent hydrolase